jgi:HEAT repeat protein
MQEILEKATALTRQENWSSVNQCLQQLPLENHSRASQPLKDADTQRALNLALQVLESGNFQERWDVAKLLPKFGEVAIAPLVEILEDEAAELELRWYTARILGAFHHPRAIVALVELLQATEDEDLAQMAADALVNLGDAAVDALSPLLADEDTRLLAVQTLAQIRRTATITPLLSVVDDPQIPVRVTALEALSSFHDARIPPVLLNALDDPAAVVRKTAVMGLGLRTDLRDELHLVSHLKPLLWDFNLEVCQQAAIALGRMRSDEAAAPLWQVLNSPATPVPLKIAVVRALGWMEIPEALDSLQQGLREPSATVCREIITVLGRCWEPSLKGQAAEIAIAYLHSEQETVREMGTKQAIALALGELGEPRAMEALIALLADTDEKVRLHAIAALRKLPDAQNQLQQHVEAENLSPELRQGIAVALKEWEI